MKSKPNPFLHMITWGYGSGIILVILYMFFILGFDGIKSLFITFTEPLGWLFALIIGGFSCLGMSLVNGFILWFLMRFSPLHFIREDMETLRWSVYAWLGSLAFGGYFLTLIFFQWILGFELIFNLLLYFPPIIAAIIVIYAVHRYLFRLRLWSEQAYGARKEKVKNDALGHLEDKPKNELYLQTDETLENEQQL